MANGGWYGTQEEWRRIEAPLKTLDPGIESFAEAHGLIVTKNHKDWPERSVAWGNEVRCLIQIFLVDETKLTLNFWLCASEDRADGRYWKTEMPRREVLAWDLRRDLSDLLDAGKRTLDGWSSRPDQLELAVLWKR